MLLDLEATLVDITDLGELEHLWTDLQVCSDHSYFTSWGWIGCWLNQLPESLRPQALIVENADGVVGLGLIHRHRILHGQLIPSTALFLNETGDPVYDSLTIEHNGFLAIRGDEAKVVETCIDFLCESDLDWDELFLSGADAGAATDVATQNLPGRLRRCVKRQKSCFVVDVAALRDSKGDYLASLSSNTRSQVRRAMRLYEEIGPLKITCVAGREETLAYYDRMKALHTSYWETRNEPGAFAHPFIDGFHRHLIETREAHGEIQLLHVTAGEQTIGYLYNFVHAGRVYNYQSGFQYMDNPKLKPGLVCHTLAIEFNRQHGADVYDFLAGEGQHKQSLGKHSTDMVWMVLQRDRARFRVEDLLRSVKRRCGL